MGNKRRYTRVALANPVHFESEESRLAAQSVDISREGMRVVVNVPDDHKNFHSITFTLPGVNRSLEIPCSVVHRESAGDGAAAGEELGLEFAGLSSDQHALIEHFIREQKERELLTLPDTDERSIPRTPCMLTNVECAGADVTITTIDNISTEGLLISHRGELRRDMLMDISFRLEEGRKPIRLSARVMYVLEGVQPGSGQAGLQVERVNEVDRNRLHNFVIQASSGASIEGVERWIAERASSPDFRVADRAAIESHFRALASCGGELHALFPDRLDLYAFRVLSVDREAGSFLTDAPPAYVERSGGEEQAKGSFTLNGGGHFFTSTVVPDGAGRIAWELPSTLYRLEKRASDREPAPAESHVSLQLDSAWVRARLLDRGPGGFRCEVPLTAETVGRLREGAEISYVIGKNAASGEIRHVVSGDGSVEFGVQADVSRGSYRAGALSDAEWEREQSYETHETALSPITRLIHYRDAEERSIAALLNATAIGRDSTVVIIPPAFGKKKEAHAPLSLALLRSFAAAGEELVTLRYDGIDRPGESSNAGRHHTPGYEMLHYRISQGRSDLRSTIDYARNNRYFTARRIVLVTFSMSALDARKLLCEPEYAEAVDQWISVMGVPAAQSALSATLGGIDAIGNSKMGIPTGIVGLLGHLVDMDRVAADLIENEYAHITEARTDMAAISVPVLWLYGRHDGWVQPDEVHDIMSVAAPAEREVLEIPAGHNLRTSDDAVKTFRHITAAVLNRSCGEHCAVVGPDRDETLRMIADERARLQHTATLPTEEYWHRYLLGDGQTDGYDFYRNLPDFRHFLQREAELTEPFAGARIADIGCGTGIFLETLLRHTLGRLGPRAALEVSGFDLVSEALSRAREKAEPYTRSSETVKTLEFRQMDLEPNRLLPIADLLADNALSVEALRGRVEGLSNTVVDSLSMLDPALIGAWIRGGALSAEDIAYLEEVSGEEARDALCDLNLAARFLGRNVRVSELRPEARRTVAMNAPLADAEYRRLSAGQLRFRRLYFGSGGLDVDLPIASEGYDRVVASLFISYVFSPIDAVRQLYRITAPGGRIVLSSMRPDSDVSLLFTDFVSRRSGSSQQLENARHMLNQAAGLLALEEEGFFRFFTAGELESLLRSAGFTSVTTRAAMGRPSQAVVAVGCKE